MISMTWFWESWISRTLVGRVIDINDMVSQVLGISRTLFERVIGILVVCDFALVFALAPISPLFCHFFALALAFYFTLS